jgi:hypothetical protein
MIHKPTQRTNSIDYIELLEYKLQQDLLAQKKILKWARTIQTRIEQTKANINNLKRYKPNTTTNRKQVKTISRIPIPSKSFHKTTSNQEQPIMPNVFQPIISNQDTELTNITVCNSLKPSLENEPKSGQSKTIRNDNKQALGREKSSNLNCNSYIKNIIETYVQNRFDPLEKRLQNLDLQIDSNERLIRELNINMRTISKNVNDNGKELESALGNIKYILLNSFQDT